MAELVDALALGASAARRGGSSPPFRTTKPGPFDSAGRCGALGHDEAKDAWGAVRVVPLAPRRAPWTSAMVPLTAPQRDTGTQGQLQPLHKPPGQNTGPDEGQDVVAGFEKAPENREPKAEIFSSPLAVGDRRSPP